MKTLIKSRVELAQKLTTHTPQDRGGYRTKSGWSVENAICDQVQKEDMARWAESAEDAPLIGELKAELPKRKPLVKFIETFAL